MKRYLVPVFAGVVVFGAVTAFAATLNVTSDTLGAGDAVVASCNATADVKYVTTYNGASKTYDVSTANVTSAVACNGKAYKLVLDNGTATGVAFSGTLSATGTTAVAVTGVTAKALVGVSLVIA